MKKFIYFKNSISNLILFFNKSFLLDVKRKMKGLKDNKIKFYSEKGEYGYFSNFAPYPIILEGKTWKTTEHYFQAKKFEGTEYEEMIREVDRPNEAAKFGRAKTLPLRQDWEEVKEDFMYKCVHAKFTQHKELGKKLLDTGDAKLIEHTVNDSFWADGGDGSGLNRLGIILMKIRQELKEEQRK